MERIRGLISQLTQMYGQLSKREQMLVSLAGVACVVFVTSILYATTASGISKHDASIREKQDQLKLVEVYAQSYAEGERARRAMEAKLSGPPVRLLSRVQELADKYSLVIAGMTEKGDTVANAVKESLVEVQIREAPVEKLTSMLNDIEHDQRIIKVRKLSLRSISTDSKALNANFTVSTFQLAPKT
jgi:general secretion pathway protein M